VQWQPPYRNPIPRSSGGGGGGSTTSYTTTETTVPDWVAAAAAQNIQEATQLSALPFQAAPPSLAGLTPDQTAALQSVREMQGIAPAQIQTAMGQVANLPSTIEALYNPAVGGQENTIWQNVMRNMSLTQEQIAARAVSQGTLGGSRYGIDQAMALSGAEQQIGAGVSGVANTAWLQATQEALQQPTTEANLALAQQQATLTGTGAEFQTGTAQQTLQQAQLSSELQQFQAMQNWPYQQLSISQSALAGTPYGSTVTSSQPYSSNTTASTLGMIASMIPTLVGLPSTIRNIGSLGSTIGSWFSPAATSAASTASDVAPIATELGIGTAGAAGAADAAGGLAGTGAFAFGGFDAGLGSIAGSEAAAAGTKGGLASVAADAGPVAVAAA
jgi:hypothetical protein